jgi:hypothetical protein
MKNRLFVQSPQSDPDEEPWDYQGKLINQVQASIEVASWCIVSLLIFGLIYLLTL